MPISGLNKPQSNDSGVATDYINTSSQVLNFVDTVLTRKDQLELNGDVPVIHVSSAVSGAAHLYERLRYSVDYHEEQVLRRHALARILRRRFESINNITDSSRSFLVELIHAGYLKNDSVPEVWVNPVQDILNRYNALFNAIRQSPCRDKDGLVDWFLGVAAAELDDFLSPHPSETALIELAINKIKEDNPLHDWDISGEEQKFQMTIAAYRALYVLDLSKLHYILLLMRDPNWKDLPEDGMLANLPTILRHHQFIDFSLQHPAGEQLFRIVKKRSLVFHVLDDIVRENHANVYKIFSSQSTLSAEVEKVCNRYYKAERKRLWRSALRSTFYIFLTKVLVALAIEAPVESLLYGDNLSVFPLAINILFPPILIFLLTATTRFPSGDNTSAVTKFVAGIVGGVNQRLFPEEAPQQRSSTVSSWFLSFIYLLTFILSFGLISYGLVNIGFTAISIAFFLFFLCVVSFFAIRIRQPVKDLLVIQTRDNIFVALIQFFSLPILKVGRWISLTSSKFNVLLYLFDYFLEAPVKSFLLITEDVLGFFRQKREDII